jgi:hypothetical protein
MRPGSPLALGLVTLVLAAPLPAPAQGMNCESLREAIAAKFRAGGVARPRLDIVPSGEARAGKVVGSCALGSRRIVHLPDPPAAGDGRVPAARPAPVARKADDAILTECRDGSVSIGGSCGRR